MGVIKRFTVACFDSLYLTGSFLGFCRPTPSTRSTKPYRVPPKTNKQPKEVGTSQKPPKASRQATKSVNQSTFQVTEDTTMDWPVDDSLCSILRTWKLKCENILEAECSDIIGQEQ